MWRASCVLRKSSRRNGWLSRQLADLPRPSLQPRRRWNDIGAMTPHEKHELLHGSWRDAKPVKLMRVTSERDDSNSNNNSNNDSNSGSDEGVLTFASDEEAMAFVCDEAAAAAASACVPTLQAARNFYEDMARSADEEVDVDSHALATAHTDATTTTTTVTTTAQRRDEERDVQRHFFADYYEQQGVLVPPTDRYAFVDAMLRPCVALFRVNAEKVLQRLTVRAQLEAHVANTTTAATTTAAGKEGAASTRAAVWSVSTVDALLYALPCMPTQQLDEPPRVPYTAAQSCIAQREAAAATAAAAIAAPSATRDSDGDDVGLLPCSSSMHEGSDEGSTCDDVAVMTHALSAADALQRMLQDDDDNDDDDSVSRANADTTTMTTATVNDAPTTSPLCARVRCAPPTLAQLQWLQRQVAADTLSNVNELSVLLSIVAVRAAVPYRNQRNNGGNNNNNDDDDARAATVIVDLYGTYDSCDAARAVATTTTAQSHGVNGRVRTPQSCSYYRDMAQYLHTLQCNSSSDDDDDDDSVATQRAVVVVALPPSSSLRLRTRARGAVRGVSCDNNNAANDDDDDDDVADVPPIADCTPQMLYVRRRRGRRPSRRHNGNGSSTTSDVTTTTTPQQQQQPRCERNDDSDGDALRGACDVVVCTPPTSEDGVRPRVLLGDGGGDANNNDGSSSSTEANAPANRFVAICATMAAHDGRHFRQLCARLRRALRCARDGGWVLYATHSLNPLENEAVVCAVLTALQQQQQQQQQQQTMVADEDAMTVTCVPLHAAAWQSRLSPDECAVVRACVAGGRGGVSTWLLTEGAPSMLDADACDASVRASVAAAAWRTLPLQHGSDGGFVIALHVRRHGGTAAVASTSHTSLPPACVVQRLAHGNDDAQTSNDCTSTTRRDECGALYVARALPRARECVLLRGSALHVASRLSAWPRHTHATTTTTTTTQQQQSQRHEACDGGWELVQCGVPVGCYDATHALRLSSAACGVSHAVMRAATALVALTRPATTTTTTATTATATSSAPLVVSLSIAMLCELLRLRTVRARDVRRRLYHLRKQRQQQQQQRAVQPSLSAQGHAHEASDEDELRLFLRSMHEDVVRHILLQHRQQQQQQRSDSNSSSATAAAPLHAHVVLTPRMPSCHAHDDHKHDDDDTALHPAVAEELAAVRIVAAVTVFAEDATAAVSTTTTSLPHSDDAISVDYVVSLDTPHAMPARARHDAALREVCVGLRDALLYVQRRIQRQLCRRRCAAATASNDAHYAAAMMDDVATSTRHLLDDHYYNDSSGSDRDGLQAVTLREDEYTTIATPPQTAQQQQQRRAASTLPVPYDAQERYPLVSARVQRASEARLRRLRTRLQRHGIDVDGGGGDVQPHDWAHDVRRRPQWRHTTR